MPLEFALPKASFGGGRGTTGLEGEAQLPSGDAARLTYI